MEQINKEQFKIVGEQRLQGEVFVKSAKNSVLPIIACCLLSDEDIIVQNVPDLLDIKNMLEIMREVGAKIEYRNSDLYINCKNASATAVESNLTGALRSSIFLLGPCISKYKRARLGLPGGCAIGARPIDIHIKGLKDLGVAVKESDSFIDCDASKLQGANITLKFPSVGATENLMMAAVLANGTTTIHNAAQEPEIVDLANFINTLGGRVYGAGTKAITMRGITRVRGGIYRPFGDRIVAPTYLTAGAITQGSVTVRGINPNLMLSTLRVFAKSGCKIEAGNDYITVSNDKRIRAISELATGPHPGFPTDMQAQIVAMLATADGTSLVKETIFENRFKYASQLVKLGANIEINGSAAKILGVKKLRGATLHAEDLRGGAALTLGALASEGTSIIKNVHHIDRGYEGFEKCLRELGGEIVRENDK